MKNVIIVESPVKAKKIKSFFKDDTVVLSSFGHIIDLDKKQISIDIEDNFKPNYNIIDGKGKIVKTLRNYSKGWNILLAADDDREGDAIAWHCGKIMNVDFSKNNRIIYNEISKKAILNSMNNVHKLNMNSVNAQQGRRILDRLVGYSLSPLLWKHIDTNVTGLSAGRVQSTLLLILKENEDKIKNHKSEINNEYIGYFNDKPNCNLIIENNNKDILNILKTNKNYKIKKQYHKEEKKYSAPPFITSTLQQAAQNELGFSVKTTMNIAQKLFENGKITYMRTDSTTISEEFLGFIKNHIVENYGENYFNKRIKGKKIKGAQEAHECIRITNINEKLNDKYTDYDKKLYNLIRKRTICSQMKPAIYDILVYELSNKEISNIGYFKGEIKVLIYDGYLRYSNPDIEIKDKIKDLKDEIYHLDECVCSEIIKKPPQYPNESSIVKKLESSGIGRPSTYASLISTLYNRNYTEIKTIKGTKINKNIIKLTKDNKIEKSVIVEKLPDQKNKIVLTELGEIVLKYLMEHFSMIINIKFTSLVEKDLDKVALGEIEWERVVGKVYDSFKDNLIIQKGLKNINSNKKNYENKEKELGEYKGKQVILKDGKFGYYVTYNKKNHTLKYLLENNPMKFDEINLESIINIIKYPMNLGKHDGNKIEICIGPYGKYMKYKGKNYKIPQKEEYTIDECIRKIY